MRGQILSGQSGQAAVEYILLTVLVSLAGLGILAVFQAILRHFWRGILSLLLLPIP